MALTATRRQEALLQLKTYDDLRATPDDGNRYELIFGEIVMSPAPRTKHQLVLGNLQYAMRRFVEQRQLGVVMHAPVDVRFSRFSVVQPDLLFISRENRHKIDRDFINGAPDLVVEALSPSNRLQDLSKKAALYGSYSVPEYWVVDPENETIVVNQWVNDNYAPVRSRAGIAKSVLLPGFEVRIQEIFTEPAWMASDATETE